MDRGLGTSQPRRRVDWDEPRPQGGRITNSYVPTEQVGCLLRRRSWIHEEMFRGAIGQPKERVRSNPTKNRNQSTTAARVIQTTTTAPAVLDEGTRTTRNNQARTHLTTRSLSEMSILSRLADNQSDVGVRQRAVVTPPTDSWCSRLAGLDLGGQPECPRPLHIVVAESDAWSAERLDQDFNPLTTPEIDQP